MSKFCGYCGNKLENDENFCSNCGKSVVKSQNPNTNQNLNKTEDFFTKNNKYFMILIPIVAVLFIIMAVVIFSGGIIGSDLVDVTSVTLDHKYFYANSVSGGTIEERPIKGILDFSFMPKENIDRVTGIGLQNVKFTYANGQTEAGKSCVFNSHENVYISGLEYSYSFIYQVQLYKLAEDNIRAYFDTTHVSGDIVVNTTSDINKVIGHIDKDVVPPSK